MISAVLNNFNSNLIIESGPEPEINNNEVLIRVSYCGIDGTDLKLIQGYGYKPNLPFVMGHEISGTIIDKGKNVKEFDIDDNVIIYNFSYCGKCTYCNQKKEQLCDNVQGIVGINNFFGGYSTHVKLPQHQIIKLDNLSSLKEASVLCDAGLTAKHAITRSELQTNDSIIVLGIGGVGSFVLQFAAFKKIFSVAIDINSNKENWSYHNGANNFLNFNDTNIEEKLLKLNSNKKYDIFYDVVGTEKTINLGLSILKPGGKIITIGYANDNYIFQPKLITQNEIQILGCRAGTKQDLLDCAKMFINGKLKPIVKHEFELAKINDALTFLRSGENIGRIVLKLH